MERIGIIGAMEEEVSALIDRFNDIKVVSYGLLDFVMARLENKEIIIVKCGIGKVNAAMCTQILIDKFDVSAIINTGVAGGIDSKIKIGDIVVSSAAIHHDFDTTAFGNRLGEIPRMDLSTFPADEKLVEIALDASYSVVGKERTHLGLIASGDQFISSYEQKEKIAAYFQAACAEMEGAAIAHVAYLNRVPFVIIRAISDQADSGAAENFNEFLTRIVPQLNDVVYSVCSR